MRVNYAADQISSSPPLEVPKVLENYSTLRRQRELLVSIPGIAGTTAARILGQMPNITEFRDVKAVGGAFVGLSPRHYQSGSIAYRSRLVKTGNAHLRRALYFPAITAMRHNTIRAFAERLSGRGKAKMTVVAKQRRAFTEAEAHCRASGDGRLVLVRQECISWARGHINLAFR